MKVLHLTDRDAVGGGARYIQLLRQGMPDVETRVLYAEDGECRASVVNRLRPDIIHVSHLKALSQLYSNPFSRPRCPVVFTVHGVHIRKYDFLPHSTLNNIKRFLRRRLEKHLYDKVDAIIALTAADRDLVFRLYGRDLPVCIVPNGIDFSESQATREKKYDYVSIARFCLQKGQRVLVEAVAKAQDAMRSRGSRVLMAGVGEDLECVKGMVENLGLSDIIEFSGEADHGSAWLSSAKVVIAPSLWEGFPFLLLEAAAHSMPVIASDCHGHAELIKDGETGLLFHVNDATALSKILEMGIDERYQDMGRSFHAEISAAYPLSRMIDGTREVYGRLSPASSIRQHTLREI